MLDSSPEGEKLRPHPLAELLIARLHPGARVFELGGGRGRNTVALRAAGLAVTSIPDDATDADAQNSQVYDGFLSTHGLLHGDPAQIATRIRRAAGALVPGAVFYATLGSKRDARFGKGRRLGAQTFAPQDGDERGVPHTYFDRAGVHELLDADFNIEDLTEPAVDDLAGSWAHSQPLHGAVHWFVRATRR